MAIINEIKCARCDRKYSGVRSRCPYCGARRIGRGKYSEDSDNAKGKMLLSVLIMAVFVVGISILLFTTPTADAGEPEVEQPSLSEPEEEPPSLPPEYIPPPEEPQETPDVVINLSEVRLMYGGNPTDGFSVYPGERIPLDVYIEPPGIVETKNLQIEWTSSDEDRFEVIPQMHNGHYYKATVVGVATEAGSARLTVTVGDPDDGGKSASILIHYRRPPT